MSLFDFLLISYTLSLPLSLSLSLSLSASVALCMPDKTVPMMMGLAAIAVVAAPAVDHVSTLDSICQRTRRRFCGGKLGGWVGDRDPPSFPPTHTAHHRRTNLFISTHTHTHQTKATRPRDRQHVSPYRVARALSHKPPKCVTIRMLVLVPGAHLC